MQPTRGFAHVSFRRDAAPRPTWWSQDEICAQLLSSSTAQVGNGPGETWLGTFWQGDYVPDRTVGRAGPGFGVAAPAEDLCQLSGDGARSDRDVHPAEAERAGPADDASVVPPDVSPAVLGRMRKPAVELDDQTVGLERQVAVSPAAVQLELGLAFGWREPVRTLDVEHVTMLKGRQHPAHVRR